jgi:hypothetical protein
MLLLQWQGHMSHNKCKKCGKDFIPEKGLVNHCSLYCRNQKPCSEKTKSLKSKIIKKNWADGAYSNTDWSKVNSNPDKIKNQIETWEKKTNDRLLSGEPLHVQTVRKILTKRRGNLCYICGLSDWLGDKISLETHHIDGNNKNNTIDNLQILCPNCHSQTNNYRGKNIKQKK